MQKNILAIIPARGGSKGIKKKNLKQIDGVSLVNRAVMCARKSKYISDILVSTDCNDTIEEVGKIGLSVPFKRPDELSGDFVGDIEILIHGLTVYEKYYGKKIDLIVMLQPTSPLRNEKMVDECISQLLSEKLDAVWTVSRVDLKYHPLKQLKIETENGMGTLFNCEGEKIIARQQLSPTFVRNGACYVFSRSCIIEQRSIYGKKMKLYEVVTPQVSIDTIEDLDLAQQLLNRSIEGS